MKNLFLVAFILASVVVFGQKPNFKLSGENFKNRKLVILDMDSVISQQDSLTIVQKWIGSEGIVFKPMAKVERKEWGNEQNIFVQQFKVSDDQVVFGLIAGGKMTQGIAEMPNHETDNILKYITYLIVDSDKLNSGFEATIVMTLCDLLLHVGMADNWEDMLYKTGHNEWMNGYKTAIVDKDDIAEVYRHQSELKKIGVENITFSNSNLFKTGALSKEGNIGYIDRQFFTVKNKEYIATTIYTLGKGLAFHCVEDRGPKGEYRCSKAYLEFLFQDAPMKAGIPYEQQMRAFKTPSRQ
jgi:hypothetical protein